LPAFGAGKGSDGVLIDLFKVFLAFGAGYFSLFSESYQLLAVGPGYCNRAELPALETIAVVFVFLGGCLAPSLVMVDFVVASRIFTRNMPDAAGQGGSQEQAQE